MEINVNNLTGPALDWAVGTAIGKPMVIRSPIGRPSEPVKVWEQVGDHGGVVWFAPSVNWGQGGPLIDKFKMSVMSDEDTCDFVASIGTWRLFKKSHKTRWSRGPTALVAACRAIVSAKLGPVANVPDELL